MYLLKKNKRRKKTTKKKTFYDWATTGIPVMMIYSSKHEKFAI